MMVQLFFFPLLVSLFFLTDQDRFVPREKLSEYNFFHGSMAELQPAAGVYPYTINTPLFSNYAEKIRFFRVPAGQKVIYRDSGVFEFPEGTILIKNFYYPSDFRNPEKGKIILETRLLVHEEEGWQGYPYIWNEAQTEAHYDPAGETREVKYINASGRKVTTPYLIPNKNQCKGCHLSGDKLIPLGPSAWQMNTKVESGEKNQLQFWHDQGVLDDGPEKGIPAVVWDDPSTGNLNDRARAYLDANCAHCHSRKGSANTSGLYLDIYENDLAHLGVFKSPVAAGRGSGNMKFDIVPGEPKKSILIYRMHTNDPAIAMPEIGREQIHKEGVALIEEWIRTHTFSDNQQHDRRGK